MIEGEVSPFLEAAVGVEVIGPAGRRLPFRALVDTGFNGYMSLPQAAIRDLNLPHRFQSEFMLADGRTHTLDVYLGHVTWHGRERAVYVVASESGSLVGMKLLQGSRLTIDCLDGGPIRIEKMEP